MTQKPTYEELEKKVQNLEKSESDRHQIENELRESEDRYKSLFNNNHSVMLLVDPENADIVDANLSAISYYGWSLEELIQKKITDINILPNEKIFQEMERAKNEQRGHFFFRHCLSSGEIRDVEVYCGPISVCGKNLLYSIVHDVTEAQQLKEALQQNEALLNATQELTKVGGWEWDIEQQSMFWTNEVYQIHDFQPDEFARGSLEHIKAGIKCYDIKDRPVVMAAFKRCAEKGQAYDLEFPFTTARGRRIWIRTVARPVMEGDKVVKVIGNIMDITKQKQAEELLRESEERYKGLFMNMNSGVAIYKVKGDAEDFIFTDFNKAAEKIDKQKKEELIGRSVFETRPQIEEFGLIDVFREVWKTGKPKHYPTTRYQDKRLNSWYENFIYKLPSGEIVAIFDNKTDLIQAEQALKESESKFRLLANYTYDWEYWVNPYGKFIYLSPSCERITGYSVEEILSNPQLVFEMVRPDYTGKVHDHYLDENNQDTPIFSIEFPIITKNGKEVWLEHNCNPVYDDQGNYAGRRGNNRDITKQKQAAEDLRSASQLYEDIIASSPIGISIYNDIGDCVSANQMAAEVIGATKAQMLQQNYHQLDSWKKSGLYDIALSTMQSKIRKRHEIHVKSTFEKVCILDIHLVPIDIGGTPHLLIMFEDISERRKMEDQYHQAQKMESVGRLAGGVAHDFNNALSVITGYAEMAIDSTDPSDPLHEDFNEILIAGRRAADITRQLLAFARKQTIAPKILDLNENVENMLKMLRRLIGEDLDLAWMPGANLWSVKMDPTQIDQVLANLCVNARDAIEGVGKITLESKNLILTDDYCIDHAGFVPGEFVKLSVSDNGCGIKKEILDNIFEPFFTTKDVDKGTGLGLSTVYGIAKQNKGFINVYSEPDKGTTINLYLPRHEAVTVKTHEEIPEEILAGQGETVLVVEDDPSILNIMEKILEGLGYTVLTSSAPEKTMDMVKEYTGKIHLLITDVIMPKMNGRDLAEQLQSSCPDLKCIFMSGYTADAIARQGVLDKGVNFIQKPFSRKDLAGIVRKVLDENNIVE